MDPLLDGEKSVAAAANNRLFLTNYRVYYKENRRYVSMRIAHVSFIEYEALPVSAIMIWTIILSIIPSAIAGAAYFFTKSEVMSEGVPASAFILFIGCVVYAIYRKRSIKLGTSGGCLSLPVEGLSRSEILHFIQLLETEIHGRIKAKTNKPM